MKDYINTKPQALRQIFLLISMPFLLIVAENAWAQKIDTIYFQKGDRITGEVKSLQ